MEIICKCPLLISYVPVQEVPPKKREQIVFPRKITINYLHLHCSQLVNTSMSVLKNVH